MAAGIQDILSEALRKGATDVHLGVDVPPVIRIDGDLHYLAGFGTSSMEDIRALAGEILTRQQLEDLEESWEVDFSFTFTGDGGESSRFRGNCFYERGNLCLALRTIPTKIRTIKELNLPEPLAEVTTKHRGLFLVTGPTGSGKSTTLASLIQEINLKRACHIVTIEDPIEYLYSSETSVIHQREVGSDTRSFAEALKRVLRQDPDVILIGEMRDLETIAAAVTAAETGHLVFATLFAGLDDGDHEGVELLAASHGVAQRDAAVHLALYMPDGRGELFVSGLLGQYVQGASKGDSRRDHGGQLAKHDGLVLQGHRPDLAHPVEEGLPLGLRVLGDGDGDQPLAAQLLYHLLLAVGGNDAVYGLAVGIAGAVPVYQPGSPQTFPP